MATFETFNYTPTELAAQLTSQTHVTLSWLLNHDYITIEQYEELASSLVVTAIQNKPHFGNRLLARFFKKERESDSWVFPITQLDEFTRNIDPTPPAPEKTKPNLEVVK